MTMKTDGHWPAWTEAHLIGCECGWTPLKRSMRMSMQHIAHQRHRRTLGLQPVEYAWSDAAYGVAGALSTGGYVQVKNAEWRDGHWVPKTTTTGPADLARKFPLGGKS